MRTLSSPKTWLLSTLLLSLCMTGCATQRAPNPQCYPAPPPKPAVSPPTFGQFSRELEEFLQAIGATEPSPNSKTNGKSN